MKTFNLSKYVTNGITETSLPISNRDFIFICSVNPEQYQFSMIISKDVCCNPDHQFRLEMHVSGHVALFGLDVPCGPKDKSSISVDQNGWYSVLTSNEKLPLHKTTTIKFQRIGKLISLYFNGKLVGEYQTKTINKHENPANLRVGSRYPPQGTHVQDPFIGEISNIHLMTLNWSLEKFLWIGNLKEDASYCPLARVPKDIIHVIGEYL